MKIVFGILGGIVGIIVLVFGLELLGLGFTKFFEPKRENIRREVFENTKSYVHGKVQDLARYYEQYQAADDSSRTAIRNLIQIQFADFNENNIQAENLKRFLINMRGF